jgi:hypothetical protein
VCDDIDALSLSFGGGTIMFSLAPGSPTLTGFGLSAADVFGGPMGFGGVPPAPVVAPAALLGLAAATDNIDTLESTVNGSVPVLTLLISTVWLVTTARVASTRVRGLDVDLIGDACDRARTPTWMVSEPGLPANLFSDLSFILSLNEMPTPTHHRRRGDNRPVLPPPARRISTSTSTATLRSLPPRAGRDTAPFNGHALERTRLQGQRPGSGDDSAKRVRRSIPRSRSTRTRPTPSTLTNTATSAVSAARR